MVWLGALRFMTKFFTVIARDQMDVRVRDVEALDFHANACRAERSFEMLHKPLSGRHDSLIVGICEIIQMIDLRLGYDKRVTWLRRGDIEKSIRTLVFVDFVRWDLAVDNFGKN